MKKMNSIELRELYQSFFESKGHSRIPSSSLVPENDPTVLFTTAGMHALVPYLMGEKHPAGTRLTNVQKCIRTQDIEEIGDERHDTFFEMMGNWSLGDYFKKEAIEWSWEFLTSEKYLGIDPRKLAVTVFEGDQDAPRDEESAAVWKELGVPENRIGYLPKKNNWWGPAGQTGPCGPDTEMFYWKGAGEFPPEDSNPANDEDNWLEIWNDVFMQYNKKEDGSFEPLKQTNVDTGMGLERTLMVMNGYDDVFQIDTFSPIIEKIEAISGKKYKSDAQITKSMRIVADHIRSATMIMSDDAGVAPSNVDRGYIVRRLIRRAVRHGRNLGITTSFCGSVAEAVIRIFENVYSEVKRNSSFVLKEFALEEEKFSQTLEKGLHEFSKMNFEKIIPGADAFMLFSTFGFPIELTQELALEKGLIVDLDAYDAEFKKHQDLSRAGAEQKFAGGLADHSAENTRLHTATHLLHKALKLVLGEEVNQKGSNITPERLRFDFNYAEKLTPEQIKKVEDIVNEAIAKDYPVSWSEMTFAEAKQGGAIGLFEDKYGDRIKVYKVGDFSMEVCGGPHVEHTGELGGFKILKEESSGAGIRRIKAQVNANLK